MDRKLSKKELIELVEKICTVCGNEEQLDYWIEIIEKKQDALKYQIIFIGKKRVYHLKR